MDSDAGKPRLYVNTLVSKTWRISFTFLKFGLLNLQTRRPRIRLRFKIAGNRLPRSEFFSTVVIDLLFAFSPSVMSWIVSSPPQKVEVLPRQHFRMWLYLKPESLLRSLVKRKWTHTGLGGSMIQYNLCPYKMMAGNSLMMQWLEELPRWCWW